MKLTSLMFLIVLILFIGNSGAVDRKHSIYANIGPATQITNATALVSIATTTGNQFNCLEYVVVRSTNIYTLSLVDNNTTFYQMTKAANEEHKVPLEGASVCSSANSRMLINMVPLTGTNVELNYKGYVGK